MSKSNIVTQSLSHSHLESPLFGFLKFYQQGKLSVGGLEKFIGSQLHILLQFLSDFPEGRVCRHFPPQGSLAAETSLCELYVLSEGVSLTL